MIGPSFVRKDNMILNYISNTIYLVIYLFENTFNNNVISAMYYIFILIVVISMFKKLVGIK